MDKCPSGKFFMDLKIGPEHSEPVDLLKRGTEANVTTILILSYEAALYKEKEYSTFPYAKLIIILAKPESTVIVITSKRGPMTIDRIQTAKPTQKTTHERGIHEVCTNFPFQKMVTNFLKNPTVLHRYMCIALGKGHRNVSSNLKVMTK